MDGKRFDAWTRALTAAGTRRALVRRVSCGALGALVASLFGRSAAACHGTRCNTDGECCAGTNCLLGECNTCAAAGRSCSSRVPCCRQTRTTCCGAICVNTRTSNAHCGRCGNFCGKGRYCSNGLCCPTGTVNRRGICCLFTEQNCGGQCKNLNTDRNNCGFCGKVCLDNQYCSSGKCCVTGFTNCGGSCVNLRSNPNHCGQCGRRCPSGRCVNRVCQPLES